MNQINEIEFIINKVENEQNELDVKRAKLFKFIYSNEFYKLDFYQEMLLRKQYILMSKYSEILNKRLKNLRKKVKNLRKQK